MSFCYECGLKVKSEWKFCPNCKTSLMNENTYNQASFTQKDSVIVGDVTINQQNTNFESQTLICKNCGSEGNITLKPCTRLDCSIKSCENCLQRYKGHCGPRCHTMSVDEAHRAKMIEDERARIERQRMQKRNEEYNKILQKEENIKLILGVIFLAIPAIIMAGYSFYSFTKASESLDYTCSSGEQIDGWKVLDENSDCSDGSDEMNTEKNLEHKQWVEEQNDTMQPGERNGAISCCGFFIFGFIFYYAILEDFWEIF